jgi:hypothetical protein
MGQDPSEVRHDVEDAREQLGDTVEALAYKANAPKRLKDEVAAKLSEAKARIETDPRTAKVKTQVHDLKDHASALRRDYATPSDPASPQPSPHDRLEPAIKTIKRLPPRATAMTATALIVGWIAGRKSRRTTY